MIVLPANVTQILLPTIGRSVNVDQMPTSRRGRAEPEIKTHRWLHRSLDSGFARRKARAPE
jgi:hypothetical protein